MKDRSVSPLAGGKSSVNCTGSYTNAHFISPLITKTMSQSGCLSERKIWKYLSYRSKRLSGQALGGLTTSSGRMAH